MNKYDKTNLIKEECEKSHHQHMEEYRNTTIRKIETEIKQQKIIILKAKKRLKELEKELSEW